MNPVADSSYWHLLTKPMTLNPSPSPSKHHDISVSSQSGSIQERRRKSVVPRIMYCSRKSRVWQRERLLLHPLVVNLTDMIAFRLAV